MGVHVWLASTIDFMCAWLVTSWRSHEVLICGQVIEANDCVQDRYLFISVL